MNTLKTIRLWLEPDADIPQFQRLNWDMADVSIQDVLLRGVHPWCETHNSHDAHPSLVEGFLRQLNAGESKLAELDQMGYCNNLAASPGLYYMQGATPRFERTVKELQSSVYFVKDLRYVQLIDIAKRRLAEAWRHETARTLAQRAYPSFQDLRHFLKRKERGLKLSGYGDLDHYDLDRVLSVADFEGRDTLLISEALPIANFRRASMLESVADAQRRLRLLPEITAVSLTLVHGQDEYVHLVWHVERNGATCRFRPDIGRSELKRAKAQAFAKEWREDEGRLCFSTSMNRLSEMVEGRIVVPSFPTLNYAFDQRPSRATAELAFGEIAAYGIPPFPGSKSTADVLKDILREYGVSMTGNKDALLRKLAQLASERYEKRRGELDGYFGENRFVRIAAMPAKIERFPLLDDEPLLCNLLLSMYALKHLRASAVLDPAHENATYTVQQLAHALLLGKVGVKGAFLRVG
jgi:hypothetical protein